MSKDQELSELLQKAQSAEFDEWLKSTCIQEKYDDWDYEEISRKVEDQPREVEPSDEPETDPGSDPGSEKRENGMEPDVSAFPCVTPGTSKRRQSLSLPLGKSPWKYLTSSELEERRMILADLDVDIQQEVKRHKSRIEAARKQWESLEKQQEMLANAVVRFDLLLKACKEKRDIALGNLNATNQEKRIYQESVENNLKLRKAMNNLLVTIESRIENHRMFEHILRDVKNHSKGHFKSVRDVINRAQLLDRTRFRLMDMDEQNKVDMRFSSKELARFTERSKANNRRDAKTLEEVRKKNRMTFNELAGTETQQELAKSSLQQRNMIFGQMRLCVDNLHKQLSEQLGIEPTVPPTEPLRQIEVNTDLLQQLNKLSKTINAKVGTPSDIVAIEEDTQALEKLRLRYKM